MKKNFKFYALIWAILLAVWCAVVFLARPIIPRYVINYDARFWLAFVFIVVAFIGNLVCAYLAFKAENIKKGVTIQGVTGTLPPTVVLNSL